MERAVTPRLQRGGAVRDAGGERQTPFTYADGATTELRVGLERGNATVEFQKSSFGGAPPGTSVGDPLSNSNPLIGPGCWDMISIETTLAFTTDDGGFAETWPVSLLAWDLTAATGGVSPIDLETLMGRYAVTALDLTFLVAKNGVRVLWKRGSFVPPD